MPSRHPWPLLAALLAVLAVTAGCSHGAAAPRRESTSDRVVKTLAPGTCWSGEQLPQALGSGGFAAWVKKYADNSARLGDAMRDDSSFSRQIDCSAPHSIELYNVVALSPELAGQVSSYADLLDPSSTLYRRIRDQVNDRCLARSPYGVAQRRAGGMPVQLGPELNAGSGLTVAWDPFPADLWAKGQHEFVCTFEQQHPGTTRFADVATSKLPTSARVCLNTPRAYLPCSRPHQAEDIGVMILNTAIEQGAINGTRAVRTGPQGKYVALGDDEYARLDKVCQTLLDSVSTVKGGVVGRAYPGSMSQWPTRDGAYLANCFALKPYEPPPKISGTVFDRP